MSVPSIRTWFSQKVASVDAVGFPAPPNAEVNDVVVIALMHYTSTTVIPPAGFTLLRETAAAKVTLGIYWKRLSVVPDPVPWVFILDDTQLHPSQGFLWVVKGCVTTGDAFEVDDAPTVSRSGVTTTTPVSFTTRFSDSLILFASTHSTAATFEAPPGFSLLHQESGTQSMAVAHKDFRTAGPTGDIVGTWSTVNAITGWAGALRSAYQVPTEHEIVIPPLEPEPVPDPVPQEVPHLRTVGKFGTMPRIQQVIIPILRAWPDLDGVRIGSWVEDVDYREFPMINIRRMGGGRDDVYPKGMDVTIVEMTAYSMEGLPECEHLYNRALEALYDAVLHQKQTDTGYLHSIRENMGMTQFSSLFMDSWRVQGLLKLGLRPKTDLI